MARRPARQTYEDGWNYYPRSTLGHHALGALSGALTGSGIPELMVMGVVTMAGYVAYQGLSVIRKKDSAGLDTADGLVGYLPAGLATWGVRTAWQIWW